jgi:hypothetical protein
MCLENARDLIRGLLLLSFVAIALWFNLGAGLFLVVVMGLLILQSAFSDWCPADWFLRPMGLKKKLADKS